MFSDQNSKLKALIHPCIKWGKPSYRVTEYRIPNDEEKNECMLNNNNNNVGPISMSLNPKDLCISQCDKNQMESNDNDMRKICEQQQHNTAQQWVWQRQGWKRINWKSKPENQISNETNQCNSKMKWTWTWIRSFQLTDRTQMCACAWMCESVLQIFHSHVNLGSHALLAIVTRCSHFLHYADNMPLQNEFKPISIP